MLRSGGAARAGHQQEVLQAAQTLATRRTPLARSRVFRLALAALALAGAGTLALLWGSVPLSAGDVIRALARPSGSGLAHTVVWELRSPRVLIAASVGAGLGVSGAMLQALFRNPLVDPYVTGVSAGAALAATIAFVAGVSYVLVPAIAFGGGLACAALVVALAAGRAGANLRVVLAGVAVSALCSAGITLVLLRSGEAGGLSILSWLAGGLSGRGWSELRWLALYLVPGLVGASALAHRLNVLRLGEESAAGLGLDVVAARWQTLSCAALLAAACVAVSGVVGFVGLMVPHGARRLFGGDMRWLLPASAAGGALVVVVADAFARALAPPTELPLGVLLALVGVPFFLAIARRPVQL